MNEVNGCLTVRYICAFWIFVRLYSRGIVTWYSHVTVCVFHKRHISGNSDKSVCITNIKRLRFDVIYVYIIPAQLSHILMKPNMYTSVSNIPWTCNRLYTCLDSYFNVMVFIVS